jgi:hypothetical protein
VVRSELHCEYAPIVALLRGCLPKAAMVEGCYCRGLLLSAVPEGAYFQKPSKCRGQLKSQIAPLALSMKGTKIIAKAPHGKKGGGSSSFEAMLISLWIRRVDCSALTRSSLSEFSKRRSELRAYFVDMSSQDGKRIDRRQLGDYSCSIVHQLLL